MSLFSKIVDGIGNKCAAHVTSENALMVTQYTCPPMIEQKNKPFRQYLTDDGLSAGTNDMQVDGSSTNVDYWVPAHVDNDRYLTSLSFVIADDGVDLDEFGAITALTNGCRLFYTRGGGEEIELHEALKTNWDFVRLANGNPAFGTGAAAFKANDIEGKVDAYIPILDLTKMMPPYGIKLDAGTKQKMVLTVKDDTRGVDAFNCIAYGFERFV